MKFAQLNSVARACVYSTNRFHVAVRLFSNRLHMTSKCGKNKRSGTRGDSKLYFPFHETEKASTASVPGTRNLELNLGVGIGRVRKPVYSMWAPKPIQGRKEVLGCIPVIEIYDVADWISTNIKFPGNPLGN